MAMDWNWNLVEQIVVDVSILAIVGSLESLAMQLNWLHLGRKWQRNALVGATSIAASPEFLYL